MALFEEATNTTSETFRRRMREKGLPMPTDQQLRELDELVALRKESAEMSPEMFRQRCREKGLPLHTDQQLRELDKLAAHREADAQRKARERRKADNRGGNTTSLSMD
jgi:hypothetical protein